MMLRAAPVRSLGMTLFLTLAAGHAAGQSWEGTPPEFRVHWAVQNATGRPVDLTNTAFSRKAVMFPGHGLGNYPMAGPHMIELYPGGKEAFYASHAAAMPGQISYTNKIPDPAWDGWAVIDYELWGPQWTFHENTPSYLPLDAEDRDFIDDWKQYIRQSRPELLLGMSIVDQEEVFKRTWLAACREFFTRTIEECRRLRPNAKWGFYCVPPNPYYTWVTDAAPHGARRAAIQGWHDDELGWLNEVVDAYYPCFYTIKTSVPSNPNYAQFQDSYEDNARWMDRGMAEFQRMANGKPVVPMLWYRYMYNGQAAGLLNDYNLDVCLRRPHELGCSDLIMWGWVDSDEEHRILTNEIATRLSPAIAAYTAHVEQLRNPGGGSGGSGGSGGGSGGGTGDTGGGSGGGTGDTGGGSGGGGSGGPGVTGGGSGGGSGDTGGGSGGGVGTFTNDGGSSGGGSSGGSSGGGTSGVSGGGSSGSGDNNDSSNAAAALSLMRRGSSNSSSGTSSWSRSSALRVLAAGQRAAGSSGGGSGGSGGGNSGNGGSTAGGSSGGGGSAASGSGGANPIRIPRPATSRTSNLERSAIMRALERARNAPGTSYTNVP